MKGKILFHTAMSSDDESRSTVPASDDHAMNPWAKPAVTIEIQEVEIHWSAIGTLLLGLLTLPLLLMTAGGGLLGSFEAPSALLPNDMYDDYAWVASNWMFLHLMAFLVCMPFFVLQRKWDSAEWASSVLALLYCLHQFEEHAWDVTGSRYPFARHLAGIVGPCTLDVNIAVAPWKTNSILGPFFAQDSVAVTGDCGFDEHVILWINVYFVVGALFIMPVFVLPFECRDFALLQNACLVAVNGLCFHMAPAAASGKYNPGLLQSIFMNTPFAIFVIVFLYRSGRVSSFQLVCSRPPMCLLCCPPCRSVERSVTVRSWRCRWWPSSWAGYQDNRPC